jgi:glycerate kinase
MRVVVAPSSFAGTLSAAAAARAIAAGWVDTAPGDTLVQLPVSGGGPGLDCFEQPGASTPAAPPSCPSPG